MYAHRESRIQTVRFKKPLSFIKFVNYTHWMCAGAGCFFLLLRFIWFFLRFTLRFWKAIALFFFHFFSVLCILSFAYLKLLFMPKYLCTVFTVLYYFFCCLCNTIYDVVSLDRIEFLFIEYVLHFSSSLSKSNRVSHAKGAQHNHIASKNVSIFFYIHSISFGARLVNFYMRYTVLCCVVRAHTQDSRLKMKTKAKH